MSNIERWLRTRSETRSKEILLHDGARRVPFFTYILSGSWES